MPSPPARPPVSHAGVPADPDARSAAATWPSSPVHRVRDEGGGEDPEALASRRRGDRLLLAVFGDLDGDEALRARRRLALSAVVAIALASMVLSTVHLLAAPPFTPPDETPHVGYALALLDGEELPRTTDIIDGARFPQIKEGIRHSGVTHPPLVYLLLAIPLGIGESLGDPIAGLFAARGLMVASAGIGYLLLGWLALALLPRRLAVALTAVGIAALIPNHVHIAGQVYTDAPGFAAITGLLLAGVLVLLRGPSAGRLTALLVLAAVAANFRVVGAVAAVGVAGAAGLGAWLHADGRRGLARLGRGVGTGVAVAGSAAATSAWFYATNLARYGSVTGADELMIIHEREPIGDSVLDVLLGRQVWRSANGQMWNRVETWALEGGFLPREFLITGRWLVHALLIVAVLVAAHRLVAGGWRRPAGTVIAWTTLVVWLAVVAYGLADFVQGGGGMHARYLWPAIAIVVLWLALGLAALPGARWGLPSLAFVSMVLAASCTTAVGFVFRDSVEGARPDLRVLAQEDPSTAVAVLAAVGVLVALLAGWWAQAVVRLARHDEPFHVREEQRADRRATHAGRAEGWGVVGRGWLRVDVLGVALAWALLTGVGWLWRTIVWQAVPAWSVPVVTGVAVAALVVVVSRRATAADVTAEQPAEETVSA